ncbi:hypothetical protein ISN45_At05g059360 [Arabidopsis thaliana x Arabidopsis arenosa]|uniref:Uncharacterized protein n=1 Tax=Arabidopsis thaliana x Arabidopsis arenosa TaxID=1240361 RepID=A0A8T2D5S7_9BRAS|nr:hypothetical protein ISN45_At05g059360 [Arabidopsis thaliana x Arabidopsis arenosa]
MFRRKKNEEDKFLNIPSQRLVNVWLGLAPKTMGSWSGQRSSRFLS